MKGLLAIIQKIYGKSALSKTIGTRTNVIKLPNNEIKQYIKKDLNIEAASDKLAEKAKQEMLELVPDVPKMNDAERLIFEGNLRRLDNKLNPPMAEVTEFGTKQKVSPEGIQSLIQEKGQKAAPGTLMGNLESRLKQLEASGKGLEELTKGKGQTLEDIMTDALQSQGLSKQMYNEGLVRATARDIITADIKSGKLQLPKQLQQDLLEGGGEPIEVLRTVYGEDALEVLDSLIPEFSKLRTSTEAADLAKSKFKFEPDVNRPKGSMSPEEAIKAEQENILKPKKPEEPEEFAIGGRAGYSDGTKPSAAENTPSQEIIDRMIAQIKQLSKRGVDVATIKDIVGASDQMIKDVLGKASGGRAGYSAGSIVKGILLTAKTLSELKPEYLKKLSRLEGYLGSINMEGKGGKEAAKQTIDKIDNLKKEYKALQKDLSEKEQLNKLDITDRVPNAQGGVSQGLDYLMGIERPNYQLGGSVYDRYQQLLNEISNPTKQDVMYSNILYKQPGSGSDSGFGFTTPTKEESEATLTEGMTDVGENRFGRIGSMIAGGIFSAINPLAGIAYSLSDPNSITRSILSKIGYNPTTEGSINGPFGGYGGFTGTEGTFSTDSSDTGASGGFDSAAEDSDQSGGDAGSTSGTDSAGDGGDGYAIGGRVRKANGGLSYLMGI